MRPPELRLRLAAILAADAVAYSRLMSIDARGTIEALETARRTFRTLSVAHEEDFVRRGAKPRHDSPERR